MKRGRWRRKIRKERIPWEAEENQKEKENIDRL